MEQALHIDGKDALRAADGDVDAGLVRSEGYAEGLRGVVFKLVEGNFNGRAHVGAKEGNRIGEGAAVFEVSQRHKVFGVVFGHSAQAAIGGEGEVEDARDCVQRDAIENDGALGVDHSDFGLGCGAMRRRIGIDVRAVDAAAVG